MTWWQAIWSWLRPRPGGEPLDQGGDGDLLAAVNRFRAEHGRPPFQDNACLSRQAANHAAAVAELRARPHQGFALRLDLCGQGSGAENWAQAATAERAVAMWATSPGHRRNLLGNYAFAGGGIRGESAVLICGDRAGRQAIAMKVEAVKVHDRIFFATRG